MNIRTSILSLVVLGSVAATSYAGEDKIGQGTERRDASQGLVDASGSGMNQGRADATAGSMQAMGASNAQDMGAVNTQAMGASRANSTMSGERMARPPMADGVDLGLHRGGN